MAHLVKNFSDIGSNAQRNPNSVLEAQQSNGLGQDQPLKLNTSLFRKAKGQNANRFTSNKGSSHNFIAPQLPLGTPQRREGSNAVIVSTPPTNLATPSASDSGALRDTQKHNITNGLDFSITPESSFSFHLDPDTTMENTSFSLDTSWNGSDPSSLIIKPSKALSINVNDGGNARSGLSSTQANFAPATMQGAATDLLGMGFRRGHRESNKRVRESSGPKQDESKRQRTSEARTGLHSQQSYRAGNVLSNVPHTHDSADSNSYQYHNRTSLEQHAADHQALVEALKTKYIGCTIGEWHQAGQVLTEKFSGLVGFVQDYMRGRMENYMALHTRTATHLKETLDARDTALKSATDTLVVSAGALVGPPS